MKKPTASNLTAYILELAYLHRFQQDNTRDRAYVGHLYGKNVPFQFYLGKTVKTMILQ